MVAGVMRIIFNYMFITNKGHTHTKDAPQQQTVNLVAPGIHRHLYRYLSVKRHVTQRNYTQCIMPLISSELYQPLHMISITTDKSNRKRIVWPYRICCRSSLHRLAALSCGDTRGPSVVFEAVDVPGPVPLHFSHIADMTFVLSLIQMLVFLSLYNSPIIFRCVAFYWFFSLML